VGLFGRRPSQEQVTSASFWLFFLAALDQVGQPIEWRWGQTDLEANGVLNDFYCRELQVPRPQALTSWASDGARSQFVPRYFPDDSAPGPLSVAKHTVVVLNHKSRKEYVGSVVQTFGKPFVGDGSDVPAGRVVYSPPQYDEFFPWVAENRPGAFTDPSTRRDLMEYWIEGCFTRDGAVAGQLAQCGPAYLLDQHAYGLVRAGLMHQVS